MSCEKYLEMISDEVDAELKEGDSLFLMRHLVLCRDCRNEYRESLKLKELLKEELSFSPVIVPSDFSSKIVSIIESDTATELTAQGLYEKGRGGLSAVLEGLRRFSPLNAPSFSLPLAASLLMIISVGFYYKTTSEDVNAGYVLTDAKDIDAKIIKANLSSSSAVENDEFAYYAKSHSNAVHQSSLDLSIGSKRGGIIYAGYVSGGR
ncbi:MAG: hypothetical protein RQ824_04645 [bacterium]|nr:hypothetical protein [bacterium]